MTDWETVTPQRFLPLRKRERKVGTTKNRNLLDKQRMFLSAAESAEIDSELMSQNVGFSLAQVSIVPLFF